MQALSFNGQRQSENNIRTEKVERRFIKLYFLLKTLRY